MLTAEVSFIPLGTESTSLSEYLKPAIEAMRDTEAKVHPRAMATELEVEDLETLFLAVKKGQDAIIKKGVRRVIVTLKIDIRTDKEASLEGKLKSVS